MPKTNLRTIHDQTDLSQTTPLGFQPLARNWLVPFTHTNGRVVYKAVQPPGDAQQLRRARNLPGDLAQMYRATFVDPYDQPDKVTLLGNSLIWSQFTNSLHPSMIEFVDRHLAGPSVRFRGGNLMYSVLPADQHLFTKLSGR
jgi:hypothetical protein